MFNELNSILASAANMSLDELVEYNPEFSDAYEIYKKGYAFYRGIEKKRKNCFIELAAPRTSITGNNIANVLVSGVLPSWNKYPKRTNCIMGSTEKAVAKAYGTAYVMLPKNGAKIGICPTYNFQQSFKIFTVYELNNGLKTIFDYINKDTCYEYITVDEIKTLFDSLSDVIHNKKFTEYIKNSNNYDAKLLLIAINKYLNEHDNSSILDCVDFLLNPNKNKFKLLSDINELENKQYKDSEIWIDDKCLMYRLRDE